MVRSSVALLALALPAGSGVARAAPERGLGPRSLDERRSSAELAPGVRWTVIAREGGPWRMNVLALTPGVRVVAVPAGAPVGRRSRPSALARRMGGVAAVNGGYFAADGDPAGVLAAEGRLISEPVDGRTALVLDAAPKLAAMSFAGKATVARSTRLLDGVNRRPGRVPACGGRGGDRPTERPDATRVCTDPSELVALGPAWGGARRPACALRLAPRPSCATAP
jgi:hypothetical protein